MGTFSRLRYVMAANVNALIEKAEDPEKLLRALIREMEDAGEEARAASVGLLAEQKRLERVADSLQDDLARWQQRAEDAVAQDRDDLARAAIKARVELEAQHAATLDEQRRLGERVSQMEQDMHTLKAKLAAAKSKLKAMQAVPAKGPGAGPAGKAAPAAGPGERRIQRAFERFDRLQAQVDNLEARVRSYDVGGPEEPVWSERSGEWADEPADPAIEAELEKLKQRRSEEARAE